MKKYTPEDFSKCLVVHPYSSTPDYFSRINFFQISTDKRLANYYWEAPVGRVKIRYEQFDELIYILEGELEIIKGDTTKLFRKNDCLEISGADGELIFNVLKEVKAVGYVYPIDEQELGNIQRLMGV